MRIEDLDAPRVVSGSAEAIMRDLRWLGLDWDEGPDVGGPYGPYRQSERADRYQAAVDRLATHQYVYPCTCTRKEIAEIASAPHGDLGLRYPGTCRQGVRHPERQPAWRFIASEPAAGFEDRLRGWMPPAEGGGDFVVQRADGVFAYQLAVVVDDAEMAITEVVRGDDLLSSTPRQLDLYRALELPPPAFFHVPLVMGPDGKRLSKRHGPVSIADYRNAGWSASRVVGTLAASLSLVPEGTETTPRELLDVFDVARLPTQSTALQPQLG